MPGMATQSQMGAFNPMQSMQFNPTMTADQHYAMQQNWQQWQTYQQQYAQWQATYGEKVINSFTFFDGELYRFSFRILVSTGNATEIQPKCDNYAYHYATSRCCFLDASS